MQTERVLVHSNCRETGGVVFKRTYCGRRVCSVCGRVWDEVELVEAARLIDIHLIVLELPTAFVRQRYVHGELSGYVMASAPPDDGPAPLAPAPSWLPPYRPGR